MNVRNLSTAQWASGIRKLDAPRWLGVVLGIVGLWGTAGGAERETGALPAVRADEPAWREVAAWFAERPTVQAEFEERRRFPFRKEPVVLQGEVRVSRERGLSLRYTSPEERVVILDGQGVLVRDARGQQAPPDARAEAGQRALLHVLRMDLAALEKEFEVFGGRHGERWELRLAPRDAGLRRAIGEIIVDGERAEVRRIELRRSERQHITITMANARAAEFGDGDVKRFFR